MIERKCTFSNPKVIDGKQILLVQLIAIHSAKLPTHAVNHENCTHSNNSTMNWYIMLLSSMSENLASKSLKSSFSVFMHDYVI